MVNKKLRRVIEVQSDLYQKGNLEKEATKGIELPQYLLNETDKKEYVKLQEIINDLRTSDSVEVGGKKYTQSDLSELKAKKAEIFKRGENIAEQQKQAKAKDLAPLSQYNDPTAHFRMIREEIRRATLDGKDVLQFPTGETAMKIEGLGTSTLWERADAIGTRVMPDSIKVGMEIIENTENGRGERWIITEVLENGKFKALPKFTYLRLADENAYVSSRENGYPQRPHIIRHWLLS